MILNCTHLPCFLSGALCCCSCSLQRREDTAGSLQTQGQCFSWTLVWHWTIKQQHLLRQFPHGINLVHQNQNKTSHVEKWQNILHQFNLEFPLSSFKCHHLTNKIQLTSGFTLCFFVSVGTLSMSLYFKEESKQSMVSLLTMDKQCSTCPCSSSVPFGSVIAADNAAQLQTFLHMTTCSYLRLLNVNTVVFQ